MARQRLGAFDYVLSLISRRSRIVRGGSAINRKQSRKARGDHSTRPGAATRTPHGFSGDCTTYRVRVQPAYLLRFLLGLLKALT